MSAVLRHVVRARPKWRIDYQAEEGRHQVGRGIVAATFAFGRPYPSPRYDAEVEILLYDTWSNWGDRPNTRVSSCLHERFGLEWKAEFGRYQVNVSEEAASMMDAALSRVTVEGTRKVVAVHYQGDSSPERKNLTHAQAVSVCRTIEKLKRVPLVMDWRGSSPVPGYCSFPSLARIAMAAKWGGNAEMNCAVIRQCEAFVGIDSGPSKCASSTDVPALVVWTGHHPAPFHDPAPNTTHLVPVGYHGLEPVCNDSGVISWFERNYKVRTYVGDPVGEIESWLKEVLR